MDIEQLRRWLGKVEERNDIVTATPAAALSAILDRDDPLPAPGDALPPLAHWLYFLPLHRQSELGADGHAARGGFLPPVTLPRRMWAGGRLTFHQPLRVGDSAVRTSRIADVQAKAGRSGPLVFVTVRHEIRGPRGLVLEEDQDLVYRERTAAAPSAEPAPGGEAWSRSISPDEVLLFRYSAVTLNGHRIHYDRRFAVESDGYPDLVVHGPLLATLLVDLARRSLDDPPLATFDFVARRPLFAGAPFEVCGAPAAGGRLDLWAKDREGQLAMKASATLRSGRDPAS